MKHSRNSEKGRASIVRIAEGEFPEAADPWGASLLTDMESFWLREHFKLPGKN